MPTYRTIVAVGEGKRYEYTADSIIVPGDLVTLTATGCTKNVTADAQVPAIVATENEIFGRGINAGSGYQAINAGVDYAIGDRVITEFATPGMQLNLNVPAATPAIAKGAYVTAGATGGVKTGTVANAIGIAQEAVDNSAGTTLTRIRVLIT